MPASKAAMAFARSSPRSRWPCQSMPIASPTTSRTQATRLYAPLGTAAPQVSQRHTRFAPAATASASRMRRSSGDERVVSSVTYVTSRPSRIANAIGNYVGGALLQATIAGLSSFLVLEILGVPFAGPLAVVIFVFDLIPVIGPTIGAILVGIVTAFVNFPVALIVWAIFAIVYQQVENYLIQPQIQRRATKIEAFIVLVAVLFGSTLFGVLGAILAIPAAASIQIAVQEYREYRREIAAAEEEAGGPTPAPEAT